MWYEWKQQQILSNMVQYNSTESLEVTDSLRSSSISLIVYRAISGTAAHQRDCVDVVSSYLVLFQTIFWFSCSSFDLSFGLLLPPSLSSFLFCLFCSSFRFFLLFLLFSPSFPSIKRLFCAVPFVRLLLVYLFYRDSIFREVVIRFEGHATW